MEDGLRVNCTNNYRSLLLGYAMACDPSVRWQHWVRYLDGSPDSTSLRRQHAIKQAEH